jgi:hypothetical protein
MTQETGKTARAQVYARYPHSTVLLYEGVTILHYMAGGAGIMLGYDLSWTAYLAGALYLVFAMGQMYLLMPLSVCPNCVYYRMSDSLCPSGLNVLTKKIAREGALENFPLRAKGMLCHNNLYIASLVVPIILIIPALVLNFTIILMVIMIILVVLLLFRYFVIFRRVACPHCAAKRQCPNAQSMGIS